MSPQKRKTVLVQEEMERSILHGLAHEWETALWVLSSANRKLMRKPLLSVRDMKGTWGNWSGEKREICLSRKLVLNHPWDAVREVFLHEIAHQFAEEVLGAHNEPPHGPAFKKACYLLRANPKASGNYQPIDERLSRDPARSEDKIMLRVKKLMALAESQNRHEAEAAMAKAHEFIEKYNLALLEQEDGRDFISVFVGKPALRHHREEYHLAHFLQDSYFVQGIWIPAYVLEKGAMGSVLEITGTIPNIKIASYVYDFVRRFIASQWSQYNSDKGLNRYRRTDFAVGIIEGFCSKLKCQDETHKRAEKRYGLMKIQDPLLRDYMAYKYPRTMKSSRRVSNQDGNVLKDGRSIGRKLVIHKGISEKASNRRLSIGT